MRLRLFRSNSTDMYWVLAMTKAPRYLSDMKEGTLEERNLFCISYSLSCGLLAWWLQFSFIFQSCMSMLNVFCIWPFWIIITSDIGTVMFPPLPPFLHTENLFCQVCWKAGDVVWMFASPPNPTPRSSYLGILNPNVMAFGDGAFGRWLCHESGARVKEISALIKETPRSSLAPSSM